MSDPSPLEQPADVPPIAPDAPVPAADAAPGAEAAAPRVCPISGDFLPPNLRKHVDPASPVPLRMMAAKTLIPLNPSDMLGALFILTFDPDPKVAQTAAETAATVPERILGTALRDEGIAAPVLGYFLDLFSDKDTFAEWLILNPATPDDAIARCAARCGAKVAEVIGQNQLRYLRHEDIVRQLCSNPNASKALIDGVCDFGVRSGLVLMDVPAMTEARVRVFGPQAAEAPPDPGPTAEEVIAENKELQEESSPPMEEGKRVNLTQRIMKMNIAQKIKLATLGNKEVRTLLIRDTNKLVATAVVRSPRITDGEVLAIANNKTAHDDVLRVIYTDKEFTKLYTVKMALVKNPKVPQPVAMKILGTLRESDIKGLSKDRNIANSLKTMAKKMMDKKNEPKKGGDGH